MTDQSTSSRYAMYGAVLSIIAVIVLQAFNTFVCYKESFLVFLITLCTFVAIPMAPALYFIFNRKPVHTIGASLFFAPWLIVAYYTDCVLPYKGGGASMVYVAVVLYGFPSAVIGAFLVPFIVKLIQRIRI